MSKSIVIVSTTQWCFNSQVVRYPAIPSRHTFRFECFKLFFTLQSWRDQTRPYLGDIMHAQSLRAKGMSVKGGKVGSKKTSARPFSLFQWTNLISLFFAFLFVQILPDRQIVPNGSWCYISIFDGLVYISSVECIASKPAC